MAVRVPLSILQVASWELLSLFPRPGKGRRHLLLAEAGNDDVY